MLFHRDAQPASRRYRAWTIYPGYVDISIIRLQLSIIRLSRPYLNTVQFGYKTPRALYHGNSELYVPQLLAQRPKLLSLLLAQAIRRGLGVLDSAVLEVGAALGGDRGVEGCDDLAVDVVTISLSLVMQYERGEGGTYVALPVSNVLKIPSAAGVPSAFSAPNAIRSSVGTVAPMLVFRMAIVACSSVPIVLQSEEGRTATYHQDGN